MYACSGGGTGSAEVARRLLAAGARVDGAPARGDDVCTLTPLQVLDKELVFVFKLNLNLCIT